MASPSPKGSLGSSVQGSTRMQPRAPAYDTPPSSAPAPSPSPSKSAPSRFSSKSVSSRRDHTSNRVVVRSKFVARGSGLSLERKRALSAPPAPPSSSPSPLPPITITGLCSKANDPAPEDSSIRPRVSRLSLNLHSLPEDREVHGDVQKSSPGSEDSEEEQQQEERTRIFISSQSARQAEASIDRVLTEANKSGDFDIAGRSLWAIPVRVIDSAPHVCVLDLSNNSIQSLPGNVFSCFTSLEVLNLNSNALSHLPPSIEGLVKLRFFHCDSNHIANLPDGLFRHPHIEVVSAGKNIIGALPSSIRTCTSLITLCVPENRLRTLPQGLHLLPRLTTLDVSGNLLASLPPDLSLCKALVHFLVEGNPIARDDEALHHALKRRSYLGFFRRLKQFIRRGEKN